MLGLRLGLQTAIRNASAPAFVWPLDALIAQGALLRHASSVRRLLSSYTGPACRLTEAGFNSEADIPFLENGALNFQSINNLKYLAAGDDTPPEGFELTWQTAYDQSGLGRNATQVATGSQPLFGTSVEAKGAMQGNGAAKSLDVDLSPSPIGGGFSRPFFVLAVVNTANLASTRTLLGTGFSSALYLRYSTINIQSAWGFTLSTAATIGKHTVGTLVNTTDSNIYRNGALQVTGSTGSTSLDTALPVMRIGRSTTTTTTWFNTANNTISEFIVFDNDPTLFAGWPAFVAAQNAYFGIV